jgi:hypothetical protein
MNSFIETSMEAADLAVLRVNEVLITCHSLACVRSGVKAMPAQDVSATLSLIMVCCTSRKETPVTQATTLALAWFAEKREERIDTREGTEGLIVKQGDSWENVLELLVKVRFARDKSDLIEDFTKDSP